MILRTIKSVKSEQDTKYYIYLYIYVYTCIHTHTTQVKVLGKLHNTRKTTNPGVSNTCIQTGLRDFYGSHLQKIFLP